MSRRIVQPRPTEERLLHATGSDVIGSNASVNDDGPDEDALDPGNRTKRSIVDRTWSCEGIEFLPVTRSMMKLLTSYAGVKLNGVHAAILMRIALQWRAFERTTKFPIATKELADLLGLAQRTINENIQTLTKPIGLINSGGGLLNNQTWVDVQPLRRAISGTDCRLDGGVRGLSPAAAYGYPPEWSIQFAAIPVEVIDMMSTKLLRWPQSWLALLYVAARYTRVDRKRFRISIQTLARGAGIPERSARRALQALTEANPPLLRKIGERRRGRWEVDIQPLLDAIRSRHSCPVRGQ